MNEKTSSRPAKTYEVTLSVTLITIVIGAVGWYYAVYIDNLDGVTLLAKSINVVGSIAAVFLALLSIFYGGKGITKPVVYGPKNAFNKQVIAGILCIAVIVLVPAIVSFVDDPSIEKTSSVVKTENAQDLTLP